MTCLLLVCHCSMDIRVSFHVTVSCFSFKPIKKSDVWRFWCCFVLAKKSMGKSSLFGKSLGGCGTRQSGPRSFKKRVRNHRTDAERWMFPRMVVPPNHPFVHRVFHYFHHPFWGTLIFGNTHESLGFVLVGDVLRFVWDSSPLFTTIWENMFGTFQVLNFAVVHFKKLM